MNDTIRLEKRSSFRRGMLVGMIIGSLVSWINRLLLGYVMSQLAP